MLAYSDEDDMSFGNRTAQALLNSLLGKTSNFGALASRPTLYIGLSSTTPNEDGTNVTEPSGGGYARQATAPSDWSGASLADPSEASNLTLIDFGVATADWLSGDDLVCGVVYDAASGGNYIAQLTLSSQVPVLEDDLVQFSIGSFLWRLT